METAVVLKDKNHGALAAQLNTVEGSVLFSMLAGKEVSLKKEPLMVLRNYLDKAIEQIEKAPHPDQQELFGEKRA